MDGGFVKGIADFFMPPDPPLSDFVLINDADQRARAEEAMKALRYWRLKVSGTLAAGFITLAWTFTPWGFVTAKDLGNKLDQAVAESVFKAVKEIKDEQIGMRADLSMIKDQNDVTQTAVREILRGQLANSICRILIRQQKEPDSAERGRLRNDADVEQEKYKGVVGDYYPESRCGS